MAAAARPARAATAAVTRVFVLTAWLTHELATAGKYGQPRAPLLLASEVELTHTSWKVAVAVATVGATVAAASAMLQPVLALRQLPLSMAPASVPDALAVAGASGVLAAGSTTLLVPIIRSLSRPELKGSARFLAHKLTSLAFMVVASVVGVVGWWSAGAPATAAGRLLDASAASRFLSAMLLGELLLYELPLAALVEEMRKPDMLIHHAGMALVTLCGAVWIPFYYCLFYLGVAELSSIPLQVSESVAHARAKIGAKASPLLVRLESWTGLTTMAAFVLVRGVAFTLVTLTQLVPDILHVLLGDTAGVAIGPTMQLLLGLAVLFGVAFNALQVFWLARGARDAFSPQKDGAYGLRSRES